MIQSCVAHPIPSHSIPSYSSRSCRNAGDTAVPTQYFSALSPWAQTRSLSIRRGGYGHSKSSLIVVSYPGPLRLRSCFLSVLRLAKFSKIGRSQSCLVSTCVCLCESRSVPILAVSRLISSHLVSSGLVQ